MYGLESLPYFVHVHWEEIEPILDDGSGPTVIAGDYAEVWAKNAHEAKWAGYHLMKDWQKEQKYLGVHPLRGVKADIATCTHGLCLLTDEGMRDVTEDCAECLAEIQAHISIEEERNRLAVERN